MTFIIDKIGDELEKTNVAILYYRRLQSLADLNYVGNCKNY